MATRRKSYKNDAELDQEETVEDRHALSEEAREQQMIGYAIDLAEKQLKEGTASTQVIVHYLKLGSTTEKLQQEIMSKQRELLEAKTEALKSAKKVEELYTAALSAMKEYKGESDEDGQ